MGISETSITSEQLRARIGGRDCPLIFDVRRRAAYDEDDAIIPGAKWRDHRAANDYLKYTPWEVGLTSGKAPTASKLRIASLDHNYSGREVGTQRRHEETPMKYPIAPLFVRPWTLNGISPRLIESHYEVNYGGTVNRLNAITEQLESLDRTTTPPGVIHRLKRDEFTALNSMLLHELYFASLGGDGRAVPAEMTAALTRDFGSVNRWRDEFIGLAESLAAAGSAGWVLLTFVPRDGRLINHVATDDGHSLSGGIPVLVLDMYEHAYHIDFGANAPAYVAAFMRNIEWKAVEKRTLNAMKVAPPPKLEQPEFSDTPSASVEEVEEMLKTGRPARVIDVRPRHYITKATDIMDGAVWRDPERIDDWIGELNKDQPVVTFCVYGFHIGCQTASTLREKGFDAKYMRGGHYAWKAKKGAMKLMEE